MENNQVQIFENTEFGKVRTVMVSGEPWFVVSDICEYFKVSNRNRVMQTIDAEDKGGYANGHPRWKAKYSNRERIRIVLYVVCSSAD